MERYLLVAVFGVCFGLENDPIFALKNAKYEPNYEYEYMKSNLTNDFTNIDGEYKEYVDEKNNYDDKNYGDEKYQQRQRKYSNEELDELFGYTGPTANDEPNNLMRPCALNDWECIRTFFAANGKCKPAYGPIPDPIYQDLATLYFTSANVTEAIPLEIRGLSSAKITEFYVNKKSGNLVLSFDLENLYGGSKRAYFRYRRTAKESIVLGGLDVIEFGPVTFTAVLPKVPDLRLDRADCHIFVPNSLPIFVLGPDLVASLDPDVLSGFASIVGFLPVSIQEGIFFVGQLVPAVFIQSYICDFGLKLISL